MTGVVRVLVLFLRDLHLIPASTNSLCDGRKGFTRRTRRNRDFLRASSVPPRLRVSCSVLLLHDEEERTACPLPSLPRIGTGTPQVQH